MADKPTSADMTGRICLITGANAGIGRVAAQDLARRGGTVLLLCRSGERGRTALEEIRRSSGNDSVFLIAADLSSQRQVRGAAEEFLRRFERLDVLINNAGVLAGRQRRVSEDGLEMTFAVNHLAPFLLTGLLLDRLRASAPARIVTVSSGAHRRGVIDFDDLQGERRYSAVAAYCQSKLANALFTRELAQRLEGTGVTANCLHPGLVSTSLFRATVPWLRTVFRFARPFILTPEQGADTVIYLASSSEVADVSGLYFEKRKAVQPSDAARDAEAARRLWEESEALTAPSGR